MEQVVLNLDSRENTGKGHNRRLRMAGKIPAILYGREEPRKLAADPKVLEKALLSEGGKNVIYNLKGGSVDGRHALVKDYQCDPVLRHLLHVDLMEIDVSQKVDVTVPINITGKSVGVVEGGILNVIEREVEVSCLPTAIPKHIDVDVTELNIGDSIHFVDMKLPEGVESYEGYNPTIVTVVPPAKEEELQASLAAEGEPEVLTEKKKEGEGDAAAGDAKKDDAKDKK